MAGPSMPTPPSPRSPSAPASLARLVAGPLPGRSGRWDEGDDSSTLPSAAMSEQIAGPPGRGRPNTAPPILPLPPRAQATLPFGVNPDPGLEPAPGDALPLTSAAVPVAEPGLRSRAPAGGPSHSEPPPLPGRDRPPRPGGEARRLASLPTSQPMSGQQTRPGPAPVGLESYTPRRPSPLLPPSPLVVRERVVERIERGSLLREPLAPARGSGGETSGSDRALEPARLLALLRPLLPPPQSAPERTGSAEPPSRPAPGLGLIPPLARSSAGPAAQMSAAPAARRLPGTPPASESAPLPRGRAGASVPGDPGDAGPARAPAALGPDGPRDPARAVVRSSSAGVGASAPHRRGTEKAAFPPPTTDPSAGEARAPQPAPPARPVSRPLEPRMVPEPARGLGRPVGLPPPAALRPEPAPSISLTIGRVEIRAKAAPTLEPTRLQEPRAHRIDPGSAFGETPAWSTRGRG